ncbi:MAG TPA: CdaR family protein [Pyrinomonadaceae bacterium]|jgi:YbbR domain-containing protein
MALSTEKFDHESGQAFLTRMIRKIFLEDWTMKLVALVITLGLWLGVTGLRTPTSRRVTNIPLNLRVANDLEITNSPVSEVEIKISGDKSKIDQINQRDLSVSLDLTDVQSGYRTVQITPDNVNIELPVGFKLEEIQPTRIAVQLEKVVEREVRVEADVEGDLTDDFEIYTTIITPPTVRVRGPESFVRPLDSISTEKINVESRQSDFTAQQVQLNVVNPKVRLVDTTVADVFFHIAERRIEKPYLVNVKAEKGEKRASFKLFGARSVIESLRPEDIKIELTKADTGEVSFNVILPPEIQDKTEVRGKKIINK